MRTSPLARLDTAVPPWPPFLLSAAGSTMLFPQSCGGVRGGDLCPQDRGAHSLVPAREEGMKMAEGDNFHWHHRSLHVPLCLTSKDVF